MQCVMFLIINVSQFQEIENIFIFHKTSKITGAHES
jgi:hypothetical protein